MKFRGFHPEEVSSFLEQIREELEDLLRENAALKERIHRTDKEIQRFWEMQDLLSRTLQDAHQMSEEFKVQARREVDDLLGKAEETVRDMLGEAHEKALQVREEIGDLKMMRKEFDHGIRKVLSRLKTVIAEGKVFQEGICSDSDEGGPAAEAVPEMRSAVTDDERLFEDQISVIEGHRGEESSSDTEHN